MPLEFTPIAPTKELPRDVTSPKELQEMLEKKHTSPVRSSHLLDREYHMATVNNVRNAHTLKDIEEVRPQLTNLPTHLRNTLNAALQNKISDIEARQSLKMKLYERRIKRR